MSIISFQSKITAARPITKCTTYNEPNPQQYPKSNIFFSLPSVHALLFLSAHKRSFLHLNWETKVVYTFFFLFSFGRWCYQMYFCLMFPLCLYVCFLCQFFLEYEAINLTFKRNDEDGGGRMGTPVNIRGEGTITLTGNKPTLEYKLSFRICCLRPN